MMFAWEGEAPAEPLILKCIVFIAAQQELRPPVLLAVLASLPKRFPFAIFASSLCGLCVKTS
jgi:hypothetical protein